LLVLGEKERTFKKSFTVLRPEQLKVSAVRPSQGNGHLHPGGGNVHQEPGPLIHMLLEGFRSRYSSKGGRKKTLHVRGIREGGQVTKNGVEDEWEKKEVQHVTSLFPTEGWRKKRNWLGGGRGNDVGGVSEGKATVEGGRKRYNMSGDTDWRSSLPNKERKLTVTVKKGKATV